MKHLSIAIVIASLIISSATFFNRFIDTTDSLDHRDFRHKLNDDLFFKPQEISKKSVINAVSTNQAKALIRAYFANYNFVTDPIKIVDVLCDPESKDIVVIYEETSHEFVPEAHLIFELDEYGRYLVKDGLPYIDLSIDLSIDHNNSEQNAAEQPATRL